MADLLYQQMLLIALKDFLNALEALSLIDTTTLPSDAVGFIVRGKEGYRFTVTINIGYLGDADNSTDLCSSFSPDGN